MPVDGQILYGNEWIDYNKTYFKILIEEDGLYRVSKQELEIAGLDVTNDLSKLRMHHFGKEVGFYVGNNDSYIEFYGYKNRIELDQFLYQADSMILNPEYSNISDKSSYFISFENTINPLLTTSITTDLSNNTLSPEQYYIHNEKTVLSNYHYKPVIRSGDQVRYSNLVSSEGFGSELKNVSTLNVPVSNLFTAGPKAEGYIRYGGNDVLHKTRININGDDKALVELNNTNVTVFDFDVELNDLGNTLPIKLTGEYDIEGSSDNNIISIVELNYPRLFNINGDTLFRFTRNPSTVDLYIEINGYTVGDLPIIVEPATNTRIVPKQLNNGKLGFVLNAHNRVIDYYLVSTTKSIKSPISVVKRDFVDYAQGDYNYILVSNKDLRSGSSDVIQEYVDYRASDIGGGYQAVAVDIDQLYDQYGYGVDYHFIAIRNFGFWTKETYTDPKFMFLIGKGKEYKSFRTKKQIEENDVFYVPTFGYPGSDNLLISNSNIPLPIYGIGRFAANSITDVRDYLQKIKDHDSNRNNPQTIEDKLWNKKVLHLSGGSAEIQDRIAKRLAEMQDTLENNQFGADVFTFYRHSTQAIEITASDKIFELINEGLGIITFFGHSSVGSFDFSLDDVSRYENYKKYPFIMSLGCYSGNIHTNIKGISEKFVIHKNKGAIAFLAASGTAYIGQQFLSGRTLYERMGNQDFGQPIGEVVRNVISKYSTETSSSFVTLLQQLTLHGDPAIRLLINETPDLIPDRNLIRTNPTFVDTYEDDFELCFNVANIGKVIRDSIDIFIEHKNPLGEVVSDTIIRVMMPTFSTEYCATLPLNQNRLVGKNKINITVDYANEIEELPAPMAEANNVLTSVTGSKGFDFYILNNSAIPIYPTDFAIVNTTNVNLVASTYNAFGKDQNFVFQIDTLLDFTSPWLYEKSVDGVKGIAKWNLDFQLNPKTVYYWRISPDSTTTGVGYVWDNSSFVYDPPAFDGWNQSHLDQKKQNELTNMFYNQKNLISFARNYKEIVIKARAWKPGLPPGFGVDNDFKTSSMDLATSPSIGVTVIDTSGKFLWNPVGGAYGSINLKNKKIRTHYYKTNEQESRIALVDFLVDIIPNGYYVCVYPVIKNTTIDFVVEDWENDAMVNNGKNIFTVLEEEGATLFNNINDISMILPYGFIYQKGISPLSEGIGVDIHDEFFVKEQLPGFWFEGMLKSDFVGPTTKWNNIEWNVDESTNVDTDSVSISVYGYDINKSNEIKLIEKNESRNIDLSIIDANQYPYIKVEYYSKDVTNVTPVQLEEWRVYFDGIGDLAINTSQNFEFYADSLQQGEKLTLSYDVSNFSSSDVDNSSIQYIITDVENNTIIKQVPLDKFSEGESKKIDFEFNTKDLVGDYQFQIEVNPDKSPMERYFFNNFGVTTFSVTTDKTNPLLDVTFDGIQIMNNDIVSAKPFIQIKLSDENPYLLLENKDDFTLTLEYPNGEFEELSSDDPAFLFFAASDGQYNEARLEYRPSLELDGTYKLKVNAIDASSNSSGGNNYEISFRVFNEEMVSNVFNYPNPFSTSTQFIFTLTGDEEPNNVLIRIMTLTGKVVKEITMADLGQVRLGLNKTSYKWNGTDEYGDKLGNGVYLYQVITKKMDGTDYKHFSDPTQNNTDYLFKEGFGKLVIMR